jgi:nanoRNase/pAp phosphatase (c-di-AMP/oligoRNAs hydrolase)
MTYCRHNPIEEILGLPDVQERVNAYMYQKEFAELQMVRCSTMHDNLLVVDLREEDPIFVCNRFLIYALNPECNISMHLSRGVEEGKTSISVGKTILDRSSKTDIGSLLLEYGGGGHSTAGGCRVDDAKSAEVVAQLIVRITADG